MTDDTATRAAVCDAAEPPLTVWERVRRAKPYTFAVEVDVLIFGAAALGAKTDRVRVCIRDGAIAEEVLGALAEQHPGLGSALVGARLAVNAAFAKPGTPVRSEDELALISLVGGG